jgi:hypothetical protein
LSPWCIAICSHIIWCSLLTSFPTSEKERGTERGKEREREREREKELGENTVIWGVLLLLPPQAMVEKD